MNSNFFNSASLILTKGCNLECTYCYEKGNHCNINMSQEVAYDAVNFLFNNAIKGDMKEVSINFFGGEPLLNFDVLNRTFGYAVMRAQKEGMKLSGSIVTNCTVFPEKYDEFLECFINNSDMYIQLSIDGTPEVQDMNRLTKDGKGSSELVLKTLDKYFEAFKKYGLPLERLNVHSVFNKENLPKLFESYKFLIDKGFYGVWHGLVQEEKWEQTDTVIYREQLQQISDYIYEKIKETKDARYLQSCAVFSKCSMQQPNVPCGAGRSYCSITPTGDVYPCHAFYFNDTDEETKIGDIYHEIDDDNRDIFISYDINSIFAEKFCSACEHCDCYRCIAMNYKHNKSILMGFDKYCQMSKVETEEKTKLFVRLLNDSMIDSAQIRQYVQSRITSESKMQHNQFNNSNINQHHDCNCNSDEKYNEIIGRLDILDQKFNTILDVLTTVIGLMENKLE